MPRKSTGRVIRKRQSRRAVAGSERFQPFDAKAIGAVDPKHTVTLSIYVRPRIAEGRIPTVHAFNGGSEPWATAQDRQKMLQAFDADPKDLDRVRAFAKANKLRVVASSVLKRSVLVRGTLADAMRAFGVELQIWSHHGYRYRGRTGPIHVPASLHGIIEAVFGFDNRPIGQRYCQTPSRRLSKLAAQAGTFLPTDLAGLYDFPDGFDGSGEIIAILAFNGTLGEGGPASLGGYKPATVKSYFKSTLKLSPPDIADVVVHGPGNSPGDGSDQTDATDEVLLDICVAGALAPKAKLVMYFTEFTEQGWVDAVTAAVTATQNKPTVISCSYGNPEDGPAGEILWTRQAMMKVNEAFQRASLAGITICCAAGDQGSTEQLPDHRQHVDFPASSPWVLGCGGTRVVATNAVITHEAVWNDGPSSSTGGGVSRIFSIPTYQADAGIPPSANSGHQLGRGVPDVAGIADPETGVRVVSPDGTVQPIGGTSATAPMWAALVARFNQALGKSVGFFNPILYKHMKSGVLRDITVGDNGAYRAGPGWDACTGLGSPNGTRILASLKGLPNS